MQKLENIEDIWLQYKKDKSLELRNQIVLKYISLIKTILRTIKLPPNSILTSQDLINVGIIGLVEAIDKYEPEQNIKFETYAYQRIKGAIIDELRRLDWLSRSARKKAKDVISTIDKSFILQGESNISELFKELNLSEKELKEYIKAYNSSKESFFINESIENIEDGEDVSFLENLAAEEEKSTLEKIVDNEKVEIIYNFLISLPERDRLIVTLYYYENLKFKEIGNILGLSESRVSQIHSNVIKALRKKFQELED